MTRKRRAKAGLPALPFLLFLYMKSRRSPGGGGFSVPCPGHAAAAPEARLDIFPQADTIDLLKAGKSVSGMQS